MKKKISIFYIRFYFDVFFSKTHQEHVSVNTQVSSTVKWIGSKMTESHNGDIKIKSGKLVLDHGKLNRG